LLYGKSAQEQQKTKFCRILIAIHYFAFLGELGVLVVKICVDEFR